jgi:peptidoglycan/xylan/chitin deacetylase (PgdA/CDA1 family)
MRPFRRLRQYGPWLRAAFGAQRPLILMYHRVADLALDPWSLAVAPRRFKQHLEVLSAHRSVVPLDWLVGRVAEGKSAHGMVAMTFDDAYVDVLANAKPLLSSNNCPVTVFVPSGYVGKPTGFWWDTLTRIFLDASPLPPELVLTDPGIRLEVGAEPGQRASVHLAVWSALKHAPASRRAETIAQIAEWAGVGLVAPATDLCVTQEELLLLAEPGFVDLGGHTTTHPSLPTLSAEEQYREIRDNMDWIANVTGRLPRGLAFPYGDNNATTLEAARRAQVHFCCTADASVFGRDTSLMLLPRLNVTDLPGAEFERLLARHA